MAKIIMLSDMHCGHAFGLTSPAHQYKPGFKKHQRKLSDWVKKQVDLIEPDITFFLGDAVDGRGERNGGREQIQTLMEEQAEVATGVFRWLGLDQTKMIMARGTPYHTDTEGIYWEDHIAKDIGASIEDHPMVDVEGVRFSLKHKIGSSGIPHGRATALLKDALWDALWAQEQYENRRKADVLLRGHVHYHQFAGNRAQLAMTLPCLQFGSDFGSRQCQGTIDYGLVSFNVNEGVYSWQSHLLSFKGSRKIIAL